MRFSSPRRFVGSVAIGQRTQTVGRRRLTTSDSPRLSASSRAGFSGARGWDSIGRWGRGRCLSRDGSLAEAHARLRRGTPRPSRAECLAVQSPSAAGRSATADRGVLRRGASRGRERVGRRRGDAGGARAPDREPRTDGEAARRRRRARHARRGGARGAPLLLPLLLQHLAPTSPRAFARHVHASPVRPRRSSRGDTVPRSPRRRRATRARPPHARGVGRRRARLPRPGRARRRGRTHGRGTRSSGGARRRHRETRGTPPRPRRSSQQTRVRWGDGERARGSRGFSTRSLILRRARESSRDGIVHRYPDARSFGTSDATSWTSVLCRIVSYRIVLCRIIITRGCVVDVRLAVDVRLVGVCFGASLLVITRVRVASLLPLPHFGLPVRAARMRLWDSTSHVYFWCSRSTLTTDLNANHSGMSSPPRSILRNLVPESFFTLSPFFSATSAVTYPSSSV